MSLVATKKVQIRIYERSRGKQNAMNGKRKERYCTRARMCMRLSIHMERKRMTRERVQSRGPFLQPAILWVLFQRNLWHDSRRERVPASCTRT